MHAYMDTSFYSVIVIEIIFPRLEIESDETVDYSIPSVSSRHP